eukprot:scaffold3714_cov104-Phaeocystis_antarctica.AAC.3
MQGGSRCLARAIERQRARWHDPVLGRWLGLTPEQPALCLRGTDPQQCMHILWGGSSGGQWTHPKECAYTAG